MSTIDGMTRIFELLKDGNHGRRTTLQKIDDWKWVGREGKGGRVVEKRNMSDGKKN